MFPEPSIASRARPHEAVGTDEARVRTLEVTTCDADLTSLDSGVVEPLVVLVSAVVGHEQFVTGRARGNALGDNGGRKGQGGHQACPCP